MSTDIRPDGFYWVIYDNKEWQIGKWYSNRERWLLFSPQGWFVKDSDLDEIDPSPIKRDK